MMEIVSKPAKPDFVMYMKPIAIIGKTFDALLCAHVASMRQIPFVLFCNVPEHEKVVIDRPISLEEVISMLVMEPHTITARGMGTAAKYAEKVYGRGTMARSRTAAYIDLFSRNEDTQWHGMNPYVILDSLLDRFGALYNAAPLSPAWAIELLDSKDFSAIVSTVPQWSLCVAADPVLAMQMPSSHSFLYSKVGVKFDCILENLPDNTILYDGTDLHSWFRCSRMFGHGLTEWGSDIIDRLPNKPDRIVTKPISTTCNCFDGLIHRVGRMARWTGRVRLFDSAAQMERIISSVLAG